MIKLHINNIDNNVDGESGGLKSFIFFFYIVKGDSFSSL